MSSELETLDQLMGGDLPATVIRDLFPDDGSFIRAIEAMLEAGEIRLFGPDIGDVPKWQRRGILTNSPGSARLAITDIGGRRIG